MNTRNDVLVSLGLVALVGAMVAGCSGPEEGVFTFSERPSQRASSGSSSSDDEPPPAAPADTTAPAATVNPVFVSDVYPLVSTACGSCHLPGTGGAAIFFGADANATYPLFKERNYHLPNSLFVTRGAHTGPALTAEQRAAVDKWVAAEAAAADGG